MARILVTDDEEPMRLLIKEVLAMQGHTVDTANDGLEAIDLIKKNPYDLIILDRNMPKMGGIDAIRIIRSNPQLKNLKILIFTMASITKEIDEAFAVGATDYLIKPFAVGPFLDKITKALK